MNSWLSLKDRKDLEKLIETASLACSKSQFKQYNYRKIIFEILT